MGAAQHSNCLLCACQRPLCQARPMKERDEPWPRMTQENGGSSKSRLATISSPHPVSQLRLSVVPGCRPWASLSTWLSPGCPEGETRGYMSLSGDRARRWQGRISEAHLNLKTSVSVPCPVWPSRAALKTDPSLGLAPHHPPCCHLAPRHRPLSTPAGSH